MRAATKVRYRAPHVNEREEQFLHEDSVTSLTVSGMPAMKPNLPALVLAAVGPSVRASAQPNGKKSECEKRRRESLKVKRTERKDAGSV